MGCITSNGEISVIAEVEIMWKEAIRPMVYFKTVLQHLDRGTEQNHEETRSV